MNKKKNLETELKKYNIPYWKYGDKYSLWHTPYDSDGNFVEGWLSTKRECWKVITHLYKGGYRKTYRQFCKKLQNKRVRKYDPTDKPIVKADKWMWD